MPKLQPYPKYKPSNIQYLGDVPEHSEVTAVRRLFSVINGGTPTSDDENWNGTIPWATPIDLAGVNGGRLSATARSITSLGLASGSRSVPADSLIISTRAPIGYVAETTAQETAFNQGCRGLVPRIPLDIRYFRYQILSLGESLNSLGNGSTFTELSSTSLADFKVLVLPLPEQRAIADYLDRQTAIMDALVAKKQRMIELLAERRQSLITHAVTKGLDPQAPTRQSRMKPMIRLHHLITVSSGARIPFYPEDEHSAVSIGGEHIQKHQFSLGDKTRFVPLSFYLGQKSGHIQEGDTLVVKDGATIGKSMFVDHMPAEHMMVNEHVFVLRAVAIDPRYLSFLIQSKTTQDTIWSLNVAAAQPGLSKDFVKFIRVPVADLKEQHAIADYLDRQTAIMDALTEKLNRQIELLAERRQSLITHAVTGKIDVRQHKVPATPA